MHKGGMQRGSSENQGERWHTKSRRKTEIKETGVEVEKLHGKPLHVAILYNTLKQS
jgi:hypothetical protein